MNFKVISSSRSVLLALILAAFSIPAPAEEQGVDLAVAERYFQEAEAISRKDNGRLWGARLYGPMLFVDRGSRMIVTNQMDAEGKLVKKGNVFVGVLPPEVNCANTATTWAGVKWTMMLWPLPQDEPARANLMAHELFHRIQDEIGFKLSNPSNNHLDSFQGRLWLQLEWRALARALATEGAESRAALEDALIFRAYRHALLNGSAVNEPALEMNEGLAEYTGVSLRGTERAETIRYLTKQLDAFEKRPTFVRSFAYASGPAYGLLLDRADANWRKGLKATDDFGVLAEKLYSIKLPAELDKQAEARLVKYNGAQLKAFETERESNRQKRVAGYRARFIDGPVLLLPLTDQVSYSFNPNNLESLDGVGTVYPTLNISDQWGILNVTNGALMFRDGSRVSKLHVSAPVMTGGQKLEGDGWVLELKDGWKLEPDLRKGDYVIKKSAQ